MPPFQPIDARRDEFRKYLERTGVLDMFTKVLSKLMTETDKPDDAIEFIRANIGDSLNDKDTIVSLNQKLEEANLIIEELRAKLRQYEPMEVTGGDASEVVSVPETTTTVAAAPVAETPTAIVAPQSPAVVETAAEPMQVESSPPAKEAEATPAAAVESAPETAPVVATEPAKEEVTATPAVETPAAKTEDVVVAAAVPEEKKEESSSETPATAATPVVVDTDKPAEAVAVAPAAAEPAKADEKMEN